MTKLPKIIAAIALASLAVAPASAEPGNERPAEAGVNVGAGGAPGGTGGAEDANNKKRCIVEEYTDTDGTKKTRSRCAGGFFPGFGLLGGLGGLGGAGVAGLGVAAIAVPVFAASSGAAESP